MADAITVRCTAFQKMPHETIGMVGALATVPVHGLAGMMLLSRHITNVGHVRNGVREVVQCPSPYWVGLSYLAVAA